MNAEVRYHLDDGNDRALGRVIKRSFRRLIDVIDRWLPIHFSFVLIARNSEPLPLAKRDETLPCALFLFIGKCMEVIV